jgi:hypothetical protein
MVLTEFFGGRCGVRVTLEVEFNRGESLVHVDVTSLVRMSKGEVENEHRGERPGSRR